MAPIIHQLALVSESSAIRSADLMRVSAAAQRQATRDLAPIWEISATVDVFDKLEEVPVGYWPMIIMDNIGIPGAAGIHQDQDGQPFALISASSDIDEWSLTATHEALEMLVDPYGNKLVPGDSPKDGQGRVSFLVEVCDPSEAAEFAYTVNGVLVSDFYTPNYFDPVQAAGVRYSYTGAITEPRQVLRGGYLSWEDPVTTHWWQEIWFDGNEPTFRDIGPIDQKKGNLRSQVDRVTNAETAKALAPARKVAAAAGLSMAASRRPSASKAAMWRAQIGEIVGRTDTRAFANPPTELRRARRVRAIGD